MKSNRLFSKVSLPKLVLALGGLGLIAVALLTGRSNYGQNPQSVSGTDPRNAGTLQATPRLVCCSPCREISPVASRRTA